MGRNNRNLITSLFILAISLVAVTVVLADYIGPNRTTTVVVWRRLRCSYLAEHDESGPGGYYACTLTLYRTPSAGCPSTGSVAGYFTDSACGWPKSCSSTTTPTTWTCSISGSSSTEGCSDGEAGCEGTTQTVNQPPATISGSISCGDPGSNGWCRSAASLSLSGSEPLSGYSITALEGTRNGVTFACAGSSCSVDLLEGQNDFTYWALSSWGDSSSMGSASGRVDTGAPVINGTLTGTAGDNSWYVSDVTVSASASDGMSGIQSLSINVDGGGYQSYAEVTLGEGTHTVVLRAVDNAGHESQVNQSFSVDRTPPVLGLSGGSSFCPRCGDRLPLTYDVQDALSGVSAWQLLAGGVVIASNTAAETGALDWDGSGLGGGTHTLTLSVRDAAGNQSESSITITLKTPPEPEPTVAIVIVPRARIVTPFPPRPTAGSPLDPGLGQNKPSQFTFVSEPPETRGFTSPPENPPASKAPVSAPVAASPVLWGGAAAGLIGAAMVVAMEAQRKRKEEEARLIAEMERINRDSRAHEKGYASYADQVAKEQKAAWDAAFLDALAAEQQRKKAAEEAALLAGNVAEPKVKGGAKVRASLKPIKPQSKNSAVLAATAAMLYEEQEELVDPNANWVGIKYQTMGIVTATEVDVDFPVLTKVAANKWAWRAPVRYVRHDAVVTKTTSVNAENHDPTLVQAFFNVMVNPHQSHVEQLHEYERYKTVFFSTAVVDGTVANVLSGPDYGKGREIWEPYNKDQNAGQYLNLQLLLGDPGYPSTSHPNLCGELAVMAAIGYDLKDGLRIFSGLTFDRVDDDGNPYNITGKEILEKRLTTSTADLEEFMNTLLEKKGITYERAKYDITKGEFENNIDHGTPMIALVNLNGKTGFIDQAQKNNGDIPHWVTILNVFTNSQDVKLVLVYNPFNNQQEFYNWDTFNSAWEETYYKGDLNSQYRYIKPQEPDK